MLGIEHTYRMAEAPRQYFHETVEGVKRFWTAVGECFLSCLNDIETNRERTESNFVTIHARRVNHLQGGPPRR